MFVQFGCVLVYELPHRRAGHDPYVASPPQQFLDFGNQEGFARAKGQVPGDIEDLHGAVIRTGSHVAVPEDHHTVHA